MVGRIAKCPAASEAEQAPDALFIGRGKARVLFEKKNQKTFVYRAYALHLTRTSMSKSFCFFFQKEVLSFCRL
jgi:hypothetical protein